MISTTLSGELGWNSRLVDGDPVRYLETLRASDTDGTINVAGGVETVRRLFLAGVIDTLTLTIHPAVTGEGQRLFADSVPLTRLDLVGSMITPAGNAVGYQPRDPVRQPSEGPWPQRRLRRRRWRVPSSHASRASGAGHCERCLWAPARSASPT